MTKQRELRELGEITTVELDEILHAKVELSPQAAASIKRFNELLKKTSIVTHAELFRPLR